MARTKSTAYDLKASDLKGTHADVRSYEDLARWLSNELDIAAESRTYTDAEVRYWWTLYEQGRTRGTNAPWPDAADLTSPMAAEYTDALHARIMQTVFTEPVWTVEGWGDTTKKAPFVEECHQRWQEEERLQSTLDEVMQRALVESTGILEISEATETRREQVQKRVKWAVDEAGSPLLNDKQEPMPQTDPETGDYVDAAPEDPHSVTLQYDEVQPVRKGPAYDVVPYLDFLTLPAHAKDRTQIWGYAKRFWRRVPELQAFAAKGVYNQQAVDDLGTDNERDSLASEAPAKTTATASQEGPTAQKELWSVQFLADLDGKGERWYRATVHRDKRLLLRLNVDDRVTRYFKFVPFPKPGSTDGYSLIGHKIITVIEEDTAVRNMRADKAALAISSPIKKLQGALWDEYEQPFGPRAVITVRDMREVEPFTMPDVPQSINIWKQDVRNDADRLVGQNDTSLGQETGKDATLGEVRLRAGYAEVRMDLIIKRLKEPMEELGQARHNIYLRQLRDQGGRPMPQSLLSGLEARGVDISGISDGRITADMLEGQFWFKPKGSVESADLNAQMGFTNQMLAALANISKVNPMVGMLLSSPLAAKSIIEQVLRVYRWPDKQAFLGSEAQQMIQQQLEQQRMMADPNMKLLMAMAQGAPGGQPGAPQGMPGPDQAGAPPQSGMVQ
jgi:hypothetical protein